MLVGFVEAWRGDLCWSLKPGLQSDHQDVENFCQCLMIHENPSQSMFVMLTMLCCVILYRYVILPKDFEKGYKANVKKSDTDFDFYK